MNPLEALRQYQARASADPELNNPDNWKQGIMPFLPGAGGLLSGLKKATPVAQKVIPAAETLGEIDPMFTPVGGEELFNVGRGAVRKLVDPLESVYAKIMSGMGPR
jgi:hypothetical protein